MTPEWDCASLHFSHFRVIHAQSISFLAFHRGVMTTPMLNSILISREERKRSIMLRTNPPNREYLRLYRISSRLFRVRHQAMRPRAVFFCAWSSLDWPG